MNLGNKIVILGPTAAGKTTFSKKLSDYLNITHIELDDLFWKPNWVTSDNLEFRQKLNEKTSKGKWIVDGNYSMYKDLTVMRADTVIWLDYALPAITYRVIKRSLKRSITREVLWNNNRESIRRMFIKDSIILFAIRSYKKKRNDNLSIIENPELKHINWIVIKNKREEREFWKYLEK